MAHSGNFPGCTGWPIKIKKQLRHVTTYDVCETGTLEVDSVVDVVDDLSSMSFAVLELLVSVSDEIVVLVLVQWRTTHRRLSSDVARQSFDPADAAAQRHRVLSAGTARWRLAIVVTWPEPEVGWSRSEVGADGRSAPRVVRVDGAGSLRARRTIAADGTVTTCRLALVIQLDFTAVITV